MKARPLGTILGLALLLSGHIACAADWETDFDKALELAKKDNKYVLLDFSGSDWCGWCMKLDREVFSRKEFKRFAQEKLVRVLIDFPRHKPQTTKAKERNRLLATQYGVRGFPTVLLLSPQGELIARTGYQPGGAEAYIAHLRRFIEQYEAKSTQR